MPSGRKELLEMGKRFAKRLPEVFDTADDSDDEDGDEDSVFVVRHTLKQRTEKSAAAFVEGAFGKQVIGKVLIPAKKVYKIILYTGGWQQPQGEGCSVPDAGGRRPAPQGNGKSRSHVVFVAAAALLLLAAAAAAAALFLLYLAVQVVVLTTLACSPFCYLKVVTNYFADYPLPKQYIKWDK